MYVVLPFIALFEPARLRGAHSRPVELPTLKAFLEVLDQYVELAVADRHVFEGRHGHVAALAIFAVRFLRTLAPVADDRLDPLRPCAGNEGVSLQRHADREDALTLKAMASRAVLLVQV